MPNKRPKLRRRKPRLPAQPLSGMDSAAQALIDSRIKGTRGAASRECQLRKAVETLKAVRYNRLLRQRYAGVAGDFPPLPAYAALLPLTLEDVTAEDLDAAVARWSDRDKLAAGTINTRLVLLGMLGVNVKSHWVTSPRPLKWWLSPAKCEALLSHLRAEPAPCEHAALLADYVEWSSHVGMRVEETLRLTWADVNLAFEEGDMGETVSRSEVTVPGTKTAGAQASIAIALRPAMLLKRRFESRPKKEMRVFPVTYRQLHDSWQHARKFLGAQDNPLATLRALRRTAARHLTIKGMPLDVLRGYLRHSNVQTTIGYLRLVGGYSTAEQRRWL